MFYYAENVATGAEHRCVEAAGTTRAASAAARLACTLLAIPENDSFACARACHGTHSVLEANSLFG